MEAHREPISKKYIWGLNRAELKSSNRNNSNKTLPRRQGLRLERVMQLPVLQ